MKFSKTLNQCISIALVFLLAFVAHTTGVFDFTSPEGVIAMATVGPVSVKDLRMYKETAPDTWVAYGCAQSASLSAAIEMIQTTCKDSGNNEEVEPGVLSGSFQMSNILAFDHTLGHDDVWTDFLARTKVKLRLMTDETGDTYLEAEGFWENLEDTSDGTSGPASYSGTLRISGGIQQGTNS